MLKDGGSAADAAIAAMFCEGISCPQSTGLGGGFVMTIYTKAEGKVETLIARDEAPLAATADMFGNVTTVSGAKSIAVPGELKGYWELHKKYGKLPWARLVQPTIDLCRNGHVVNEYLANILVRREKAVRDSPTLAEIFIDPDTNTLYKKGQQIKRLKLAETLEVIAKEGIDPLYNNGSLAQDLVQEIRELGGVLTVEDFMRYDVRWEKPISAKLTKNRIMHSISVPGSGPLLVFMMNVLHEYLPLGNSPQSFIRIAETFKYAYAQRSKLADPRFVPETLEVIKISI